MVEPVDEEAVGYTGRAVDPSFVRPLVSSIASRSLKDRAATDSP